MGCGFGIMSLITLVDGFHRSGQHASFIFRVWVNLNLNFIVHSVKSKRVTKPLDIEHVKIECCC